MEQAKKKTIIDKVWDLFASVKLAVVIFALIALTSMVGTVLEQNAEPEKNLKILAKFFGVSGAPAAYRAFEALGFMNMYHSWWFLTLLFLFAANLIICSFDRLPRIWKLVTEKIRPVEPEYVEKMSIRKALTLKGKNVKGAVAASLKEIGFDAVEATTDRGVQYYAEKGNYTRLGVYITHLSILVIMVGALIGVFFGFNAFMNLPEGRTYSIAFSNPGALSRAEEEDRGMVIEAVESVSGDLSKAAAGLGISEDILRKKMSRYGVHPIGFEIRCDNFEVEFYGESDTPKAYRSWLSVYKNGTKVKEKSIVVNDPLSYGGITFYQSSFGALPNAAAEGMIILRLVSSDGRAEEVRAKVGDTIKIPGTQVMGKITEFIPALSFDQSGRPFSYDESLKNPAVYIEFEGSAARQHGGWILKRFPQTWVLPEGHRVEFLDFWGVEYTGMQVRKDPGVWIVYLGCIVMAVGLYITFFMSHRRIWVHLVEEKGNARIMIGASANRNRVSFERKIERLATLLTAGQKGGK